MFDLLQAKLPDKVVLVIGDVVNVLQQLQPHVLHQPLVLDRVVIVVLPARCTMT